MIIISDNLYQNFCNRRFLKKKPVWRRNCERFHNDPSLSFLSPALARTQYIRLRNQWCTFHLLHFSFYVPLIRVNDSRQKCLPSSMGTIIIVVVHSSAIGSIFRFLGYFYLNQSHWSNRRWTSDHLFSLCVCALSQFSFRFVYIA